MFLHKQKPVNSPVNLSRVNSVVLTMATTVSNEEPSRGSQVGYLGVCKTYFLLPCQTEELVCLRYNKLFRERDNTEEITDLLPLTKASVKVFRSYFIS